MSLGRLLKEEYIPAKEEYIRVGKRILKEKLSTVPATLKGYRIDIIDAHNRIVTILGKYYDQLPPTEKEYYSEELNYFKRKTIECFQRLLLNIIVPSNVFELIVDTTTESLDEGDSDTENPKPRTSASQSVNTSTFIAVPDIENILKKIDEVFVENNLRQDTNIDMAQQTPTEFLRLAGSQINQKYAGDPLGLNSFIDSINLLKQLAGNNIELLKQFIVSKLDGKARECVPLEPNSVDEIVNALKNTIKPDGSKVIEGRMLSLKFDNSKTVDYAKQAEELAEALQRSLIVEGIPQAKAKSMAVERTVEMCRQSSRSDTVESVLASSAFVEPKDVVAKFLIETNNQQKRQKEKQVFAFQKFNNKGRGNKRQFNNRQNYNNYSNQNNNNNSNYRGNRRGRGNRYNNNSRRGNRQNYSRGYGQNNNNNQNTRYINYAENVPGPSQVQWRPENQQQPHIPFTQ